TEDPEHPKNPVEPPVDPEEPTDPEEPEYPDTDKSTIQSTIKEAEALNKDYYTEYSWNRVQRALDNAREVNNNKWSSQFQINRANWSLERAINRLNFVSPTIDIQGLENVDEDGVTRLKDLTLTIDGKDYKGDNDKVEVTHNLFNKIEGQDGVFPIELRKGNNTIKVTVTDENGKKTSETIKVKYDDSLIPVEAPPELKVEGLFNGDSDDKDISFTAHAEDDEGNEIKPEVTHNNNKVKADDDRYSLELKEGENIIIVKAINEEGVISQKKYTITYNEPEEDEEENDDNNDSDDNDSEENEEDNNTEGGDSEDDSNKEEENQYNKESEDKELQENEEDNNSEGGDSEDDSNKEEENGNDNAEENESSDEGSDDEKEEVEEDTENETEVAVTTKANVEQPEQEVQEKETEEPEEEQPVQEVKEEETEEVEKQESQQEEQEGLEQEVDEETKQEVEEEVEEVETEVISGQIANSNMEFDSESKAEIWAEQQSNERLEELGEEKGSVIWIVNPIEYGNPMTGEVTS